MNHGLLKKIDTGDKPKSLAFISRQENQQQQQRSSDETIQFRSNQIVSIFSNKNERTKQNVKENAITVEKNVLKRKKRCTLLPNAASHCSFPTFCLGTEKQRSSQIDLNCTDSN